MENKPNCFINPREITECMMPIFMHYNPYTSQYASLRCPVTKSVYPSQKARQCEVVGCKIQQQCNNDKIKCQI